VASSPITPFALSLSKGIPSSLETGRKGFDKLSPNGIFGSNFE
jgi:hypothetical protein